MGGDLAQPFNDLDSLTLTTILSNFTGNITSTSFWIGKGPYVNDVTQMMTIFAPLGIMP